MSDVEAKIEKPESSDGGVTIKESRVRHAEEGDDVVPNKVPKLDQDENNVSMQNTKYNEASEEEDDEDDYDEEEEVDLEEDAVIDEVNDEDENILDESGESSDDEVEISITGMKQCQVEIDQLTQQANDEILKVEQKYNKMRRPAYIRRNKFIKKVHGFWADVFSHHPELKRVLTPEDIQCFKFLKTIELDDLEAPKSGFSIKFNFSQNPYFSNDSITKEYMLPWNASPSCKCTKIDWKPRMDLTKYNASSFFSWFCSQDDASTDDIAEIIKEELWTNPVAYYNKSRPDADMPTESESDDDDEEAPIEEQPVYVASGSDDGSGQFISSGEEDEDEDDDDEYYRKPSGGGKHGKSGAVNQEGEAFVIEDDEDDEEFMEEEEEEEDDVEDEDEDVEDEKTASQDSIEHRTSSTPNNIDEEDDDDDDDDLIDDDEDDSPMKNHSTEASSTTGTNADEAGSDELDDSDDAKQLLHEPENELNGSLDASVEEILKEPSTAGA